MMQESEIRRLMREDQGIDPAFIPCACAENRVPCGEVATHRPTFQVPVRGGTGKRTTFEATFPNLLVCDAHLETSAVAYLGEDGMDALWTAARNMGLRPMRTYPVEVVNKSVAIDE